MNWSKLSHDEASIYARRAQWAFGVVGIGAIAVAAVGTRQTSVQTPPPIEIPAPARVPSNESQGNVGRLAFNPKTIADRLNVFGNHPKPAPKPEETTSEAPLPESTTPNENVKFLGVLKEPARLVALLRIGSKQRFLATGESVENVKVMEISHDQVIIQEAGVEKRLDIQARPDRVVTQVSGGGTDPGTQPGRGAVPAMNNVRPMGQPSTATNPGHDPKRIMELRERAEREAADAQRALMEAESKTRDVRAKPSNTEPRRITPRKQSQENGDQR